MSPKQILEMLDYLQNAATIKPTGFVAPEVKAHNQHVENFVAAIRAEIEDHRIVVEIARASAIEECATLMRRWADEAGDDPRNHILRNVSRNASVAISNLASIPSTGRAKE